MTPAPRLPGRLASAALGLATALFLAALPRAPAPLPPCRVPRVELRADAPGTLRCALRGARARLAGAAPLLFGEPLDLNRAAPAALEALPGIGPVRAHAIAREREREPFCAPAELVRVRGIGARTVARLAGRVHAACEPLSGGLYRADENP